MGRPNNFKPSTPKKQGVGGQCVILALGLIESKEFDFELLICGNQ